MPDLNPFSNLLLTHSQVSLRVSQVIPLLEDSPVGGSVSQSEKKPAVAGMCTAHLPHPGVSSMESSSTASTQLLGHLPLLCIPGTRFLESCALAVPPALNGIPPGTYVAGSLTCLFQVSAQMSPCQHIVQSRAPCSNTTTLPSLCHFS